MSYFFMILQGTLPDGTTIGLLMQDGIGSQYSSLDRATEDSITLNGQAFKLDKTVLEFNPKNLMAPRKVFTKKGQF